MSAPPVAMWSESLACASLASCHENQPFKVFMISQIKHKDWEVAFRLNEAEKEAAALPPPPAATPDEIPTSGEISRFERLAEASPRAAILDVRADIENLIAKTVQAQGIDRKANTTIGRLRLLLNKGVIDQSTFTLIDELRIIGNHAAHDTGDDIDKDDAMRYRDLAKRVVGTLLALAYPNHKVEMAPA